MVENRLKGLTATKLRFILISMMVFLVAGGGALFWYVRIILVDQANSVRSINTEAVTSNSDLVQLQSIKKTLEEDEVGITRTKSVVANSTSYKYQEALIRDLSEYANKSNVTITAITFNPASTSTDSIAGLKKISITMTLADGATYGSMIRFMRMIEFNLTKMQLTGVSLVNGQAGTNELLLTVPSLTVELYVKEEEKETTP